MTHNHRLEIVSTSGMTEPDSKSLEKLYVWVDEIPLSRPKKNMSRDFSDGVMVAELVKFYLPHLVDMHNYADANATNQKASNWFCLNKKVLSKLGLQLSPDTIRGIAKSHPWVIENVLMRIRDKIDDYLVNKGKQDTYQADYDDQPEVDQHRVQRGRPGAREEDIYSPSWSEPASESSRRHLSPSRHKAKQSEMVPAILLIEKQRDADTKNETINILGQKIKRLEHLLTLKDVKIEDLNIQIHSLKAGKHNTSPSTSPNASPRLARRGQVSREPKQDGFVQPRWRGKWN